MYCDAEGHYAQCHNAECHNAECRYAVCVIMLSVEVPWCIAKVLVSLVILAWYIFITKLVKSDKLS
jgi:hypothetical protein